MRINFVVESPKLTGGTRVIMEVINGLAKKGHSIKLVTFGNKEDLFWIDLAADVVYIKKSFFQKVAGYFYRKAFGFYPFPEEETRRILKILPDADINVATLSYTGFSVHRAPAGIAFQYHMHYEPLVREEGYKKKIIEESYFLPVHKIVNSSWLARQIKEKTGQDSDGLVFPAIDHSVFSKGKEKTLEGDKKEFLVISLAKDKWWKGFPDALRAVDIVRKKGYKIRFAAFGGKFKKEDLPDDVRDIEFEFVGSKVDSELVDFYCDADILISASYFESFPLPPLEAMACGVPVVTTPHGTEDYTLHEENCLISEPKNPLQMAESIIRLIEDRDLYEKISRNGLKTAKKFTWDAAVGQMEKIFLKHLNG